MRPKIKINTYSNVKSLPSVGGTTPIRAVFAPDIDKNDNRTGLTKQPSDEALKQYYKQLHQFSKAYVTSNSDAIAETKKLTAFVKEAHTNIVVRDLDKVNVNAAISAGFIDKRSSRNKKINDILYVMDAVDQIIRSININVNRANALLLKEYPDTPIEDIPSMQSLLDIGRLNIDRLHGTEEVSTVTFETFSELVKTKSWSSAYSADPTAFNFSGIQHLKKLDGSEKLMRDIRSGKIAKAVDIARVTKNKNVRSLLFINNLYKSVIGMGWSDLREMMDYLTPSEIRSAYNDAKKTLEAAGKKIEFVFTYGDAEQLDATKKQATYDALQFALAKQVNKHLEKLAERKEAKKVQSYLQQTSGKKSVEISLDQTVADIFAGAVLKI